MVKTAHKKQFVALFASVHRHHSMLDPCSLESNDTREGGVVLLTRIVAKLACRL